MTMLPGEVDDMHEGEGEDDTDDDVEGHHVPAELITISEVLEWEAAMKKAAVLDDDNA